MAIPRDDHTWNLLTEHGCPQARQGLGILACPLLSALLSLERSLSAHSNQSCLLRAQAYIMGTVTTCPRLSSILK